MSGFEVVGAILRDFPLLIAALEQYSKGVSMVNATKDYESVIENLRTSFITELSIYRQSCEALLRPLMLPDVQLKRLLADNPVEEAWKDETIDNGIRERLKQDYETYKLCILKLNKRIRLMARKLKLHSDLKPSWVTNDGNTAGNPGESFESIWRGVKEGFKYGRFLRLMDDINKDVIQIHTLTRGAIKLEPLRREGESYSRAQHRIHPQYHAMRVYQSLSSQWYPTCTCQYRHRANLRLDVRNERETRNVGMRFRFVLSFDTNATAAQSLPWTLRDVEIEPTQIPTTLVTSTQHLREETSQLAGTPSSVTTSPSSSLIPPQPYLSPVPIIDDLCRVLCQPIHSTRCLGFLDARPWRHHIYSISQPSGESEVGTSISLDEILFRQRSPRLSFNEQISLALTLAYAVFQLHDTPWLRENWGLEDIYFIHRTNDSPFVCQPYVSTTFVPPSSLEELAQPRARWHIKNRMVFSLGVALLELSYGNRLLSYKTDDDPDNQPGITELSIAYRLAEEIQEREVSCYVDAVTRCLQCNFGTTPNYNLSNDEFREGFYQGVISPLQQAQQVLSYAGATRSTIGQRTLSNPNLSPFHPGHRT